jgi:hypothetical protein
MNTHDMHAWGPRWGKIKKKRQVNHMACSYACPALWLVYIHVPEDVTVFLLSSRHAGPAIYKKQLCKLGIYISIYAYLFVVTGLIYGVPTEWVYSIDYIKKSRNSERGR